VICSLKTVNGIRDKCYTMSVDGAAQLKRTIAVNVLSIISSNRMKSQRFLE
jgi:hypothetical protein